MKDPTPHNRLLGRGKPPSQPVPAYLRPLADPVELPTGIPVVLVAVVAAVVVAVAVVAGFVWTRPELIKAKTGLATLTATAESVAAIDMVLGSGDMRLRTDIVEIEKVWVESCFDGQGQRVSLSPCARKPELERALVKAIVQSDKCAAERGTDETISFVWDVSYASKKGRVFIGKSGTLGAKKVQAELECVQKALSDPAWDGEKHYSRMVVAVLAKYPSQRRDAAEPSSAADRAQAPRPAPSKPKANATKAGKAGTKKTTKPRTKAGQKR